jgi:hypothetical protein
VPIDHLKSFYKYGENFTTSILALSTPIVHQYDRLSIATTKPQIGHNTQLRLNHVVGGASPLENRELLRAFNSIFLANEHQEDGGGNDDN